MQEKEGGLFAHPPNPRRPEERRWDDRVSLTLFLRSRLLSRHLVPSYQVAVEVDEEVSQERRLRHEVGEALEDHLNRTHARDA